MRMDPAHAASLFLPGLVHNFGNLLLTVQGHAMHLTGENLEESQGVILRSVQRGTESLHAVRILLGEHTDATGSALQLLRELVELGRVGTRERGLSLELRRAEGETFWVAAQPFVTVCARALHSWVGSMPTGTAGAVTVDAAEDGLGRFGVTLKKAFEAGSLPFPLAIMETRDRVLSAALAADIDCVTERLSDGLRISFGGGGGALIG